MGIRASLKHVNALSWLLSRHDSAEIAFPRDRCFLDEFWALLDTFEESFFAPPKTKKLLHDLIAKIPRWNEQPIERSQNLWEIKSHFDSLQWLVVIVPGGKNTEVNAILASKKMLEKVLSEDFAENGLVIQLKEPIENGSVFENTFFPIKKALCSLDNLPFLLFWDRKNEAIVFPIGDNQTEVLERLDWIFKGIKGFEKFLNWSGLLQTYLKFFRIEETFQETILHLSDLHIGKSETETRLSRLLGCVEAITKEYSHPVIPVITGDILDSPSNENVMRFHQFRGQLYSKLGFEPICVLGNHDVRVNGLFNKSINSPLRIVSSREVFMEQTLIGIIPFDSCGDQADLARGAISITDYAIHGDKLDSWPNEFPLLALVHHHPIPVTVPSWYKRTIFEKILGKYHDFTDEMEDSDTFIQWCRQRKVNAILHGHKHIPRYDVCHGIQIIGCGSSTGFVGTVNPRETYISMNTITFNRKKKTSFTQLRAERLFGAGLEISEVHEAVFFSNI